MPKLDIIITHYKEAWEVVEKLLTIIRLQQGINFDDIRVTVVNDGGNRLPDDRLTGMPYVLRQLDIPHGGVSVARNAGMDAADADWIMFCDCDDTFASVFSLRGYLDILPANGIDMLWTRIIVGDFICGDDILCHANDTQKFVFSHGKLYRRQFLIDENIRFIEGMPFQEDSEFNARIIARVNHTRIAEIKSEYPLYAWIRRGGSVTMSGREDEGAYWHFIRNVRVVAENKKYKEYDHYSGMVTRTVWDMWFALNSRVLSTSIKRKLMDEFVPWLLENKDAFLDNVSDEHLAQLRIVSRDDCAEPNEIIPDDPAIISAWVNSIIERSKNNGNNNK